MKSIVITGANGMLGSSLCRLYSENNAVNAVHRNEKCRAPCDRDFSFDILDVTKFTTAIEVIDPDIIIHCAAIADVDLCEIEKELAYDTNVTATANIARACPRGVTFVYISSDQVYGDCTNRVEDLSPLSPVNQYGMTKYLGEQAVLDNCPDSIIIRTNFFGWNVNRGRESFAEWVFRSLRSGNPITLFDDYYFSPIYAADLGHGIMELIKKSFTGIINIGSSTTCSKYDFGIKMSDTLGYGRAFIRRGTIASHAFSAQRPSNLSLDLNKAHRLGVRLPSLSNSLTSFLDDRDLSDNLTQDL